MFFRKIGQNEVSFFYFLFCFFLLYHKFIKVNFRIALHNLLKDQTKTKIVQSWEKFKHNQCNELQNKILDSDGRLTATAVNRCFAIN